MKKATLIPTDFDLRHGVGDTSRAWVSKHFSDVDVPARAEGFTVRAESGMIAIWLRADGTIDAAAERCAHEATHATTFLFDHIGETDATHELRPYYVGWITRLLFAEWQRVHARGER